MSEAPTDIDITEILERIPHRYPMLLVDRCEDFVAGQSIVGIKCVTVNEPFFQGHFPGYPVMPGVLIVESMAQTSAVLMSKSLEIDPAGKAIFFMSLDNCRFRAPVRPGAVLRLAVEVTQSRRATSTNSRAGLWSPTSSLLKPSSPPWLWRLE